MGPQADHLLALGLNPPTQLGKRGSLNLYWTRKLLPDSNENMSLNTLKKKTQEFSKIIATESSTIVLSVFQNNIIYFPFNLISLLRKQIVLPEE